MTTSIDPDNLIKSISEPKYIQFPLFLLRDFHINKTRALDSILDYGLYSYSLKMKPNLNDVSRQLMYWYYRAQNDLTFELYDSIGYYSKNGKLLLDEESAFNNLEFNPETEIEQLIQIFNEDSDFKLKVIEFYTMKQAIYFMGVSRNYKHTLQKGKEIHKSIVGNEPMPMLSIKQLIEFRDNEKNEVELMTFAVNVGIRSILGKKSDCKTNKKHILCRAFGYSSIKTIPKEMPEHYTKYSKRYHIDKILTTLEVGNWNLNFYSHNTRGIHICIEDRIGLEKLIEKVEMSKLKNKASALRSRKSKAREEALKKMGISKNSLI